MKRVQGLENLRKEQFGPLLLGVDKYLLRISLGGSLSGGLPVRFLLSPIIMG